MSIQQIPSAKSAGSAKAYGKRRRKKSGRSKAGRPKKPSSFRLFEMWFEFAAMLGLIGVMIAVALYIF